MPEALPPPLPPPARRETLPPANQEVLDDWAPHPEAAVGVMSGLGSVPDLIPGAEPDWATSTPSLSNAETASPWPEPAADTVKTRTVATNTSPWGAPAVGTQGLRATVLERPDKSRLERVSFDAGKAVGRAIKHVRRMRAQRGQKTISAKPWAPPAPETKAKVKANWAAPSPTTAGKRNAQWSPPHSGKTS